MGGTPSGQKLLRKIQRTGRSVTVREYNGPNSYAGPVDWEDGTAAGHPVYNGKGERIQDWRGRDMTGNGRGTDARVRYNPHFRLSGPDGRPPQDVVLFHELSHASIYNEGNGKLDPRSGWTTEEEHRVIEAADPSEADYLRDRGYGHRRTSHGATWKKQH